MLKYGIGICSDCETEGPIVKKLPTKKLCCSCNAKRLRGRKVPQDKPSELAFMKTVFNNSKKSCEECGCFLYEFQPIYVSHILSKGSYPAFRLDPRNVNILCIEHHVQWEFGARKKMKIYKENAKIMITLIHEYYNGEDTEDQD